MRTGPLLLSLAVLGAVSCREGVKSRVVPTAAAKPVASEPAPSRRRAEYYQISDG